mmetsp:Transcript_66520/g.210563  ORF Transcript_66520/g.210563 Transcript_66520/m.210563 type:complete len:276 (+) Transcript_66520:131-958(+)
MLLVQHLGGHAPDAFRQRRRRAVLSLPRLRRRLLPRPRPHPLAFLVPHLGYVREGAAQQGDAIALVGPVVALLERAPGLDDLVARPPALGHPHELLEIVVLPLRVAEDRHAPAHVQRVHHPQEAVGELRLLPANGALLGPSVPGPVGPSVLLHSSRHGADGALPVGLLLVEEVALPHQAALALGLGEAPALLVLDSDGGAAADVALVALSGCLIEPEDRSVLVDIRTRARLFHDARAPHHCTRGEVRALWIVALGRPASKRGEAPAGGHLPRGRA